MPTPLTPADRTAARNARRGPIRVIGFDVDGTLVHHDDGKTVWQVLNERFLPTPTLNRERFAMYQAGRLTYAEWVALDIGDWRARGVCRADIEDAIHRELRVVDGARETMDTLRARGYRLAIISGTLDITLELLLAGLSFDAVFTNRIYFEATGAIAGWDATRYDVEGKARALGELAARFRCRTTSCAFVGDHWNDLPALAEAGLGIAFCPKDDAVRAAADVVVEEGPLTRLLDLFPVLGGGPA